MPILDFHYNPTFFFKNAHINTISAALFRKKISLDYHRERFILSDGDFIDLDYVYSNAERLVVVLHGLEGNSDRAYVRGMVNRFSIENFDVLAFNFRGCSGEPNRSLKGYHMAATQDLHEVIQSLQNNEKYKEIYLIGFSLGGSVVLHFLSQMEGNQALNKVKGGVAISAPLHLVEANKAIGRFENTPYRIRFLRGLKKKMLQKRKQFPEIEIFKSKWKNNFNFFDDLYTGPIHGYKNASDYWEKAGAIQIIDRIKLPFLVMNASDDTFLSPFCFPEDLAKVKPNFYFCKPKWGGHVGFMPTQKNGFLLSEDFAFQFISGIHQNENFNVKKELVTKS